MLPFGATEPHNLHLPYGTDTLGSGSDRRTSLQPRPPVREDASFCCRRCPTAHRAITAGLPLSLNVQPTTLLALVRDIVESLVDSGIRKIVLLNSHGGNELKMILRELYGRTEAQLFLCFWPDVVRDCYDQNLLGPGRSRG